MVISQRNQPLIVVGAMFDLFTRNASTLFLFFGDFVPSNLSPYHSRVGFYYAHSRYTRLSNSLKNGTRS